MRDIRGLLLGVGAAMALAAGAYAQNGGDQCSGATAVGEGSFAFDNTGFATDQVPACGFNGANDMFYSYTPSGTGQVTVSTCGSGFDTILSAYDSCGGNQIACLDDFCGLQTQISFNVTQNVPVIIEVSGYNGQSGAGTLSISLLTGDAPANDDCANAEPVTEGDFAFDNTFATDSGLAMSCSFAGAPVTGDLFFSYTPSFTGTARINTCNSVGLTDTTMVELSGCNGSELACNDDTCGLLSQLQIDVTQGQPVLIAVAGWNGNTGAGTLHIEQVVCGVGNDCCLTADPVGPGTYPTDTTTATNDGTQTCAAAQTSPDIWFNYTAVQSGVAVLSMCGSSYDTALAVFDTCYGTQLACNDDFCGLQSQLTISVTSGTSYLIRVSGFAGNVGVGTLTITEPAPPANDHCANAMPVGEGDFPWDNLAADTDGFDSCGFGGIQGGGDIWFLYTPSFTGVARANTCGSALGDTVMNSFDTCNGSELLCNDDACGLDSQLTLDVTQGVPVLIRIAGWNDQRGTGNLHIEQVVCGTGNDCCATADPIGEGTFNFDTSFATNDGTASCGASALSPDIWFAYTAGSSGTAAISACGSGYDTVLAVFDTCYGAELSCNDDSCGLQSVVTLSVTQGTTYLIRVAGFNGSVGAGTLSIGICNGLEFPAGSALETELCGEDLNGGCNMPVPTYDSIALNSAVHGTAWANAGTRDTDWYTINLNAGQTITVCGAAEFNFVNYVVTLNPDCNNIQIPGIGGGAPCTTSTITFTAPSDGTYIIFAATSTFDGTPCNAGDAGNNYWISVRDDNTCPEVGSPCSPCVADYNNSGGTPDDADVAAFFAGWNNGDACADANQSGGTPDDADVSTFFALWNAGGC